MLNPATNDQYYKFLKQWLLQHPFDVKARADRFKNTLEEALEQGFPIDYIPPNISPRPLTLFFTAVSVMPFVHEEHIRILLLHGADPNKTENTVMWNGLMFLTTTFVSLDVFKECLEKTNDLNHRDTEGRTVLDLSCSHFLHRKTENSKIEALHRIQLLLDGGAKFNPKCLNENANSEKSVQELKRFIYNYLESKEQLNSTPDLEYCFDYEI